MKRFFTLLVLVNATLSGIAQKNESSYPSLLWEITGNGLRQPSYLFGTMHVSNKMVFHLSDSFYNAIASCSTVSLELDPRQWQSEMYRLQQSQTAMSQYARQANDFIRERSFRLNSSYENSIRRALSEEPYVINGLLYRTMEGQSNFQENTYLDLYIYQTARKLGKKATGVENFMESERIQLAAQEDMMKDRNRFRMNFNNENPYELQRKIQDAYRRGDLSMLDSLSQLTGGSEAYNEKFLYGRNDIQANSIDSIIKKESLFVAVGAAHLPGKRGVIEILRRKGYTLRPVMMSDRDAEQRDRIDKIKVPVHMQDISSDDGFISMKIPGQLFRRNELSFNESWQYADMENGTYYMLSRIKIHPGQAGETTSWIKRKTDSLLYENIPGRILSKKQITVNGYEGLDIVNKTRRGDIQRYHIIYTAQEVLVFKMSGNDEYVNGKEAAEFFSSIRLKETPVTNWTSYEPVTGGFKIELPQTPAVTGGRTDDNLDSRQYEATDTETDDTYMVWQKTIHNYAFLEEDTLDLSLIEESLKSSDIIDKEISRKYSKQDGYTSIDMLFGLKEGGVLKARALIRGAQYYLLTARSKDKKANFNRFFNSFRLTPFRYRQAAAYTDSTMGFTVQTPVEPAIDKDLKEFLNKQLYSGITLFNSERYQSRPFPRNAYFKNDSTGEAIQVTATSYPKYYYQPDTTKFWENELDWRRLKGDLVIGQKEFSNGDDASMVWRYTLTDTNTNRKIKCLAVLKNNTLYRVSALTDNLGQESGFISSFFNSFRVLPGKDKMDPFSSKSAQFILDLDSKDTATQKIARSAVNLVNWQSADFPNLQTAFNQLKPGSRDYLSTKTKLIQAIGFIRDTTGTEDRIEWLRNIYNNNADTSIYQNAALQALALTKTRRSYEVLKDILVQNPPIFDNSFEYQSLLRNIGDSLPLAAGLYPEILQLTAFDDYKQPVIGLLTKLVDSNYVQGDAYASYFSKLFFDAQVQARKLQTMTEREIIRNQADQEYNQPAFNNPQPAIGNNVSNSLLGNYLSLLMPFYDKNPQVNKFFTKILQSGDVQARMMVAVLFIKNKQPIPDTLLSYIAANDQYRSVLYERLEKLQQEQLFPLKYKTQEAISRSLLVNNRNYFRAVEIVPMGNQFVRTKKTSGYIYFFKFRVQKQGDWLMGLSGIQPAGIDSVNLDRSIMSMDTRKLVSNGSEREQYEKIARQMLLTKRKSAAGFYAGGRQNFAEEMF
jgi:uncharacterized protein YbaP (TraB family)